MSDRYGYIAIETLLNFCENSKDHAVTPNDFVRMARVQVSERKKGKWIYYPKASGSVTSTAVHLYPVCSECGCEHPSTNYCPNCGAQMEEGEADG